MSFQRTGLDRGGDKPGESLPAYGWEVQQDRPTPALSTEDPQSSSCLSLPCDLQVLAQ